jgi:cytidyltransferase-like protein
MKKFKLVVSGGTFDRFHEGHAAFLNHQLAISDDVLIGITSDAYVHAKKDKEIEPYAVREKAVKAFISDQHADSRVKTAPIDTSGIPKEWEALPIDAIIATEVTRDGAEAVNETRKRSGLSILPVEFFRLLPAGDGKPISSTRIRQGEINRAGIPYTPEELLVKSFSLPESLRNTLKEPFGELIINNAFAYDSLDMKKVVTVGDVATKTFLERDLHPRIAIIDFVVERKRRYENPTDIGFSGDEVIIKPHNPAGMITTSLLKAIQRAFVEKSEKTVIIVVSGEEDLAVLPVLLFAPLGYDIFYGQPGRGIVKVRILEEQKESAHALIHKLENV